MIPNSVSINCISGRIKQPCYTIVFFKDSSTPGNDELIQMVLKQKRKFSHRKVIFLDWTEFMLENKSFNIQNANNALKLGFRKLEVITNTSEYNIEKFLSTMNEIPQILPPIPTAQIRESNKTAVSKRQNLKSVVMPKKNYDSTDCQNTPIGTHRLLKTDTIGLNYYK